MKFAAFDLETAKPIPENATDLKQYMPLGISCAALAYADRPDVVIWRGAPRLEKAACREIVEELREAINDGYTLLTWNGCSFDFLVLAQESGLTEACGHLALEHVDLMLMVTFTKGHFLGLDKALTGAGLSGKAKTVTLSDGTALTNMSGAMAPRLWAKGEYKAVLEYLRADVLQLLELARVIGARKQIEWTSGSGRSQLMPLNRFLLVRECFDVPEPDVSWIDKPPSREQFVEWIPNWQQRVSGSPSPTRSASLVSGAWQNPQANRAQPAATHVDLRLDDDAGALFMRTLRWYWSPYLTTLITGPMFLLLAWLGFHFAWNLIKQLIASSSFFLGPMSSPPMIAGLALTWFALTGIPKIWHKSEWPVVGRLVAIAGVFLGTQLAGGVLDVLNVYLWELVHG